MANIRRFETPTLPITLKYDDGSVASDLEFDFLIFTMTSKTYKIEKRVEASEVEEGKFYIRFTQEETGALDDKEIFEMQINIMLNDDRIGTDIKRGEVERNLHNEVIVV